MAFGFAIAYFPLRPIFCAGVFASTLDDNSCTDAVQARHDVYAARQTLAVITPTLTVKLTKRDRGIRFAITTAYKEIIFARSYERI
jgi:hypothetical protein